MAIWWKTWWWNYNLTKLYSQLTKWKVDKMTSWQNDPAPFSNTDTSKSDSVIGLDSDSARFMWSKLKFFEALVAATFSDSMQLVTILTPKNQNSDPWIFYPQSSWFQKGKSHPCRTKTQGGNRFWRNRLFLAEGRTLEADWSGTHAQKLLVRGWSRPKNFGKILSFHKKLLSFLAHSIFH
jgi:hypothetical protein